MKQCEDDQGAAEGQRISHRPWSSLQTTMLLCLNSGNKGCLEMRIQLLSVVRPAMNGPLTAGLPLAQLEYWTLVPSYHFIWVSAAQRKSE